MPAVASLPARGGAIDAVVGFHRRAKRRSAGNFLDKNASFENGAKLGFVDSGSSASPDKIRISVEENSPCSSGSTLESPGNLKLDFSPGKKKGDRVLGLRSTKGSSDGEGDDGQFGVPKGTPRRRKDFVRKNLNTDGNPGKNLLMGNVTILKRGEKIEDVVANKSSDEEESRRVGTRVSEMNSGRGLFVREEKKSLEQYPSRIRAKKPAMKTKAVARVSQVCPVASSSVMNSKDVEIDKVDNGGKEDFLSRLGPEPNVLLKEVGSGSLRCVPSGSRLSDANFDDDRVGEPESNKRSSGSVCIMEPGSIPVEIPRVKTPDNFAGQTPEPVEHSNGGFLFEKWAGPAYANSPSPRCLPLPKFFIRHKVRLNTPEEAIDIKKSEIPESPNEIQPALPVERSNISMFSHGGFDVFATRNLRRLLQLE